MGKESKISWTEATWNPFYGCHKVSSGCKFCYMYRDQERYGQNPKVVIRSKSNFNAPLKWKDPKIIFTCSWSDWFIEEADEWRDELWKIIKATPYHTYQILTKRPERILDHLPSDWNDGYANVWLGISAENDKMFINRMFEFGKVKAKVKFVSAEPLLEEINLNYVIKNQKPDGMDRLDWVIIGAESGNGSIPNDPKAKYRYRECEIKWIESMVDQCTETKVPVFVKQLGSHLAKTMKLNDRTGSDINELPENIRYQQFPK